MPAVDGLVASRQDISVTIDVLAQRDIFASLSSVLSPLGYLASSMTAIT